MDPITAAIIALLGAAAPLVPEIAAAIQAGTDPHEAAKAALKRARDYDPGPDAARAEAIDAKHAARIKAEQDDGA